MNNSIVVKLWSALQDSFGVEVAVEPETGLVMRRLRDCHGHVFSLGEMLVTRAEVSHGERRSSATVIGSEPEKALLAASLRVLVGDGRGEWLPSSFLKHAGNLLVLVDTKRAETARLASFR